MWIKENLNPMGHRTGDCSTRAIAKALDIPYMKALELQYQKAKEICYGFCSPEVIGAVLEEHGYKKFPDYATLPKITVDAMSRLCDDIVCMTLSHTVICKNGNIYDTFDSGNMIVRTFFYKGEIKDYDEK